MSQKTPPITSDQHRSMQAVRALQERTNNGVFRLAPRPNLTVSTAAYESFLSNSRELLRVSVEHDQRWPNTVPIGPVAKMLVTHLFIYSDYVTAAGDRQRAELLRGEAGRLLDTYLDDAAKAETARGRALGEMAEGRFHTALGRLDSALQYFLLSDRRLQAAHTLIAMANVYEWLCDYDRALAMLTQAEDLLAVDLADGPPRVAEIAVAFARDVARDVADVARDAINVSQGALHGTREADPPLDQPGSGQYLLELRTMRGELLQARGRINLSLGNLEQARQLFAMVRSMVFPRLRFGIDFHLAVIATRQGELVHARALLKSMRRTLQRGLPRSRLAAWHLALADVALAEHTPEEALTEVLLGLHDQTAYPDLDLAWRLRWREARALTDLGRTKDAVVAYRAAIEAVDTLRFAPLGYVLDTAFLSDKLEMINAGIDTALATGDAVSAGWMIEMIKSRALSAVLSLPNHRTDVSDDEVLFDELSRRIDAVSYQMHAGAAVVADLVERSNLMRQRVSLLERIRLRDPRWRGLTEPAPLDLLDIHAWASEQNCRILLFLQRSDHIISVLLGGPNVIAGEQLCSAQTSAAIEAYASNLRLAQFDPFMIDISTALGVTVESLIPPDLAVGCAGGESLIVVPHRQLHLLPWAGLTLKSRRLFEQVAVSVVPSLSALRTLAVDFPDRPAATVIGDPEYTGLQGYPPLPEAGAEVADLERLYGAEGLLEEPVTGSAATDQAVLSRLDMDGAAAAVLHVSSHGLLDWEDPLSSGLLLTGSTLDAAEIIGHRCGYLEVTLSACSTGWRPQSVGGRELVGDDALGLTAAFLEAGARFLLVSIPKAEDGAARRFFVTWHRYRRSGLGPLAAYRATQLELFREDPEMIFTWAGITAYGYSRERDRI